MHLTVIFIPLMDFKKAFDCTTYIIYYIIHILIIERVTLMLFLYHGIMLWVWRKEARNYLKIGFTTKNQFPPWNILRYCVHYHRVNIIQGITVFFKWTAEEKKRKRYEKHIFILNHFYDREFLILAHSH